MMTFMQYATVRPFYGCPEVLNIAQPYLLPVGKAGAAGAGFFLAWLAHRHFERVMGWDRRTGPDRRTP